MIECPHCGLKSPSEALYMVHMRNKHANIVEKPKLRCEACNQDFVDQSLFDTHNKINHGGAAIPAAAASPSKQPETQTSATGGEFVCPQCKEACKSETILKMHIKKKHSDAAPSTSSPSSMDTTANSEQKRDWTGVFDSVHDVQVRLSKLQNDESSPLYSAKTFENLPLSENLLKGIYKVGFKKPSKVQAEALPILLEQRGGRFGNLIAQSQSGTGKTAAFALAVLARIDISLPKTQALIMAPTRELVQQIATEIEALGEFIPASVLRAVKDSHIKEAITTPIVVGTPGTVNHILRFMSMETIRIFVLDEADEMLKTKNFIDQIVKIKRLIPASSQFVLFSATFPNEVKVFAESIVPDASFVSLKQDELTVDGIRQYAIFCSDQRSKFNLVMSLYGLMTVGSSFIFCRTRDSAAQLYQMMVQEGYPVAVLTGQMDPADRDRIMDDFRRGVSKVLVSTNVLARGIDVLQVSMVINFDLPVDEFNKPDFETYLHRIGRTGRFGRTGISINLVDQGSVVTNRLLAEYFNHPIEELPSELQALEQALKRHNIES